MLKPMYVRSLLQLNMQGMSLDHIAHALPIPQATSQNPMHTPVSQAAVYPRPVGYYRPCTACTNYIQACMWPMLLVPAYTSRGGHLIVPVQTLILLHMHLPQAKACKSFQIHLLAAQYVQKCMQYCDLFGRCDVTPGTSHIKKWEAQNGNMGSPDYTSGHPIHFPHLSWSFPLNVGTPAKSAPHRTHYVLETVRPYGSGKRVD
jgi:hypothetical protein